MRGFFHSSSSASFILLLLLLQTPEINGKVACFNSIKPRKIVSFLFFGKQNENANDGSAGFVLFGGTLYSLFLFALLFCVYPK